MESSAHGLIGMFTTFLHLIAMLALGAGGFGLVKIDSTVETPSQAQALQRRLLGGRF